MSLRWRTVFASGGDVLFPREVTSENPKGRLISL
jgi:hypothetical protein